MTVTIEDEIAQLQADVVELQAQLKTAKASTSTDEKLAAHLEEDADFKARLYHAIGFK